MNIETKHTLSELLQRLANIQAKYRRFAADQTRISAMRKIASEFANDIELAISSAAIDICEDSSECSLAENFLLSFYCQLPGHKLKTSSVYSAYLKHIAGIEGANPLSPTHFGRAVHKCFEQVYNEKVVINGIRVRCYHNLGAI